MKTQILFAFLLLPLLAFGQDPFISVNQSCGVGDTVSGHPFPNYPTWGTGVSLVDFNNDGWDDITLGTGKGRHVLFYTNNGDGTFSQLAPLVNVTSHTKMVLWVDYDNDGDKDLYLNGFDEPNRLYQNDGSLNFTDVTAAAGLPLRNDPSWGASFGDYNNDGWLDLYVCNRDKDNWSNYLYKNNGDGTFTDVTDASKAGDKAQLTFQSNFVDYNNDGYQDLYMANDRLYGNSLYKNDGFGVFSDVSDASGAGIVIDAMNTGHGDINNDGFWDIYVTNTPNGGNYLLRNNGDETFTDIATTAGVRYFDFTWAGNFLDFDNDGDVDLYVSCMVDHPTRPNHLYVNQWMENGTETFLTTSLENDNVGSFANAFFDLNEDGLLDMVVPNNGSDSVEVWQNVVENENNYVKFTLEGTLSNRDGIGTVIEVWADGVRYMRSLAAGDAYLNQNSNKVHVGIGDNVAVDSVIIRWLSGLSDRLLNPAINTTHHVIENSTNTLSINKMSTDPSCAGESDGSASVSPAGLAPYVYNWSNGATGTDNISGLTKGRYTVVVEDANGDRGVAVFHLNEPAALTLDFVGTNNDGTGGSITVTPSGGTPPYAYLWNDSSTDPTISGISGGTYGVVVSDDQACAKEGQWAIYDDPGACQTFFIHQMDIYQDYAVLSLLPAPDGQAYRIRYRVQGETTWTDKETVKAPETDLILLDLLPGTTYEYQLTTRCSSVFTPWSATETFTTPSDGPTYCHSFIPEQVMVNNNSFSVEFQEVHNAERYRIRYKPSAGGSWNGAMSRFSLITELGLTPNTEYIYNTSTYCTDQGKWTDWSTTTYTFMTTNAMLTQNDPLAPQQGIQLDETLVPFDQMITEMIFEVRPNPTTDQLQVEIMHGQGEELILQDLNGQIILRKQVQSMDEQLDLSELPAGFYFLTVTGNHTSTTQKVVKN